MIISDRVRCSLNHTLKYDYETEYNATGENRGVQDAMRPSLSIARNEFENRSAAKRKESNPLRTNCTCGPPFFGGVRFGELSSRFSAKSFRIGNQCGTEKVAIMPIS